MKKKSVTDAEQKAKALARWDNEGGAPVSGDRSARKGRKARAARVSDAQREASARKTAKARWRKP